MPLQVGYCVAEIMVGLTVIISIIFVAIELRQNTYMLKKSMADQREERFNWVKETLATNNEFRNMHCVLPKNGTNLMTMTGCVE